MIDDYFYSEEKDVFCILVNIFGREVSYEIPIKEFIEAAIHFDPSKPETRGDGLVYVDSFMKMENMPVFYVYSYKEYFDEFLGDLPIRDIFNSGQKDWAKYIAWSKWKKFEVASLTIEKHSDGNVSFMTCRDYKEELSPEQVGALIKYLVNEYEDDN